MAQLRREARKLGWRHFGAPENRDLCPEHAGPDPEVKCPDCQYRTMAGHAPWCAVDR